MKKTKKSLGLGIVPLGDRVLVKPNLENEKKSSSGIIIPDTASKEKPERGVVVAVGAGKWDEDGEKRIPVSVKVGDKVLFSKYGFDEIKVLDEEYFILNESNILAIIK